ncbi:MAG: PilZ domain-containing protein [Myxococcota bacterium]|nr:PilZ domain-containing protein [Myxococcota bacterium]
MARLKRMGRSAEAVSMASERPGRSDKRRFPRQGLRIPCAFRSGEDRGRGFVIDVSADGLFLQTMSRLEPGREVHLHLDPPEGPAIELIGCVARSRKGHRDAVTVVRPGIGVQLTSAPESWYALVLAATRSD